MKRKITCFLLIVLIALGSLLTFISCQPVTPIIPSPPSYTPPGVSPSSLIPASNNAYDIGTASLVWRNLYFTSIVGVATGSDNITAGNGSVVVTHGLSGTPIRVFLTYAGNPGNNTSTLYWGTAGATYFTINVTDNVTSNVAINWRAMLADNK